MEKLHDTAMGERKAHEETFSLCCLTRPTRTYDLHGEFSLYWPWRRRRPCYKRYGEYEFWGKANRRAE